MRAVLLKLAYSNLLLAFAAAAGAWVCAQQLDIHQAGEASLLSFLSIYFIYTFAKTVRFDPVADQVNDPERTEFLLRWRRPLVALGVVGYAAGLLLSARHGGWVLATFAFGVGVAILYDVKFLPSGWRYRRLKDITGVKSLVVAAT